MKNYSAISEMYYGNRGNNEVISMSEDERKSLDRLVDIENKFLEVIKDDKNLIDIYNKLSSEQSEQNAVSLEKVYKEGFRFGFLMALDVLDK